MSFLSIARLTDARAELSTKTLQRIEYETAACWAARAVVAYEMFLQSNDIEWYRLSVGFQGEAIEHAASAGPGMADQMTAELSKAIHKLG
jgi:hypothetical protein